MDFEYFRKYDNSTVENTDDNYLENLRDYLIKIFYIFLYYLLLVVNPSFN